MCTSMLLVLKQNGSKVFMQSRKWASITTQQKRSKTQARGRRLQIRLLASMSFGMYGEGCTAAECVAVMVAGIVIASWENEVGG